MRNRAVPSGHIGIAGVRMHSRSYLRNAESGIRSPGGASTDAFRPRHELGLVFHDLRLFCIVFTSWIVLFDNVGI